MQNFFFKSKKFLKEYFDKIFIMGFLFFQGKKFLRENILLFRGSPDKFREKSFNSRENLSLLGNFY